MILYRDYYVTICEIDERPMESFMWCNSFEKAARNVILAQGTLVVYCIMEFLKVHTITMTIVFLTLWLLKKKLFLRRMPRKIRRIAYNILYYPRKLWRRVTASRLAHSITAMHCRLVDRFSEYLAKRLCNRMSRKPLHAISFAIIAFMVAIAALGTTLGQFGNFWGLWLCGGLLLPIKRIVELQAKVLGEIYEDEQRRSGVGMVVMMPGFGWFQH